MMRSMPSRSASPIQQSASLMWRQRRCSISRLSSTETDRPEQLPAASSRVACADSVVTGEQCARVASPRSPCAGSMVVLEPAVITLIALSPRELGCSLSHAATRNQSESVASSSPCRDAFSRRHVQRQLLSRYNWLAATDRDERHA